MNEKVKKVFKGFLELNDNEKDELKKAIRDYDSKGSYEQRTFSESFAKSLGPTSSNPCPCCGK